MYNTALETLIKKREEIIGERAKVLEKFAEELTGIEKAIESLSGQTIKDIDQYYSYSDQHPDYISGTEDGI